MTVVGLGVGGGVRGESWRTYDGTVCRLGLIAGEVGWGDGVAGRLRVRRWVVGLGWRSGVAGVCAAAVLGALGGCSRLRPALAKQYVYVVAKQGFLRDRVAAVSNRTGSVENGDKLEVLEHGRRFVRVLTPKGETGWIDEKTVATQEVADGFDGLRQGHAKDVPVASAVVRDDVYLHLSPGRDTERLYRLPEGEKLKMLRRATLEKALPPGQKAPVAVARPVKASRGTAFAETKNGKSTAGAKALAEAPAVPEGPPMDDWWLVRDGQGRTGWLLSRMIDVDAPDSLTRYSEGQRFVGAYVLKKVNDPEAPMEDKEVPEFVTVLSPYKAGLPYDFDQVRVFSWNVKKHRYETAFRQKNIEGYLPVNLRMAADPNGRGASEQVPAPTFSFRVLAADAPAVVPDATTGAVAPAKTITKVYRLEGAQVRRVIVLAPGEDPPEEAHPVPVDELKKHRRRR